MANLRKVWLPPVQVRAQASGLVGRYRPDPVQENPLQAVGRWVPAAVYRYPLAAVYRLEEQACSWVKQTV